MSSESDGTSDDLSLISSKNRGGLRLTNAVVDNILLACEKCVRHVVDTIGLTEKTTQMVVTRTLSYVLLNNIHGTFRCTCHSTSLIKTLILRYALIRIRHETTKLDQKDNVRQKLHKLILFNNL